MSMHKIPLTPAEEAGLRAHRLPIGTPSQLSDSFRNGMAYEAQVENDSRGMFAARLRELPADVRMTPAEVIALLSDCDMLAQLSRTT